MGCCLSREDDRFNSGSEALLPKSRNGSKRVENSVDVDLAKKEGANGSYKSPSAVVAAGDSTSKVSTKPQLPKKAVESVDLLGLNDKESTPLAAPAMAPSILKPTSTVETVPTPSRPTATPVVKEAKSLQKPVAKEPLSSKSTKTSVPERAESSSSKETKTSPKTSPKKPMGTQNEELMASAFTSVSVKAEDVDNNNIANDDNGDDNDNDNENVDEGDNDGKAMDKANDPKPKKNISSKKSKKKRKKGKK
ncbi:hypothetical protein KXD40_005984 [Peronospora effusa]|uniref:Uncharacterized protein n=1 Tax=Peronospora effusa TaxID=542832 RepID=A0A3M6VA79_9STRA|nr:hypothetical protein DD238_007363 [Peronospora effusa]RQM12247.1 hypothetical protein DD237_007692 [Peronospora effusa]UIZ25982.1 hypothetical protein KXD40_005984 [Peronospora effusa]